MEGSMRTTRFLIGLILISISFLVHSHEWGVGTRLEVETPNSAPGLLIGSLQVRVDHAVPNELSSQRLKLLLEIKDHKGISVGVWNYDIDASDEQCLRRGSDRCQFNKIILPVAAFHYGCRGYLSLRQGNRSFGNESRFVLPHCGREYLNTSTADLKAPVLIEEETLRVSVAVSNRTSITKSFPISAIVLDHSGTILWSARELVEDAVLPGVPVEVSFLNQISEKVRKLGCKIVLSSNGGGALIENDLINNDASYDWGECVEVDSNNIDIIPFYMLENNSLSFGAKNIGDVDVEMPSVQFRTFDKSGRVLENLQFRLPGSKLESFGGISLIERIISNNVCAVSLVVDPNWTIPNEIITNNQITISLCP